MTESYLLAGVDFTHPLFDDPTNPVPRMPDFDIDGDVFVAPAVIKSINVRPGFTETFYQTRILAY